MRPGVTLSRALIRRDIERIEKRAIQRVRERSTRWNQRSSQHSPSRCLVEDLFYDPRLRGCPEQGLDPHHIPPSDGREELAKAEVQRITGPQVQIQPIEFQLGIRVHPRPTTLQRCQLPYL